ncbi:glycosyltransferase [Krasilnikovia sp. MM14-A1004]|uniref:glycosyltransferase n=1 Tax=Krasilnikovia sp. MM14-A1004 TaxID=3373541 RepID=UPI00399C6F63
MPGRAGGVEMFTYGLVEGLVEAASHDIEVEVLADTLQQWRARVPSDRIRWSGTAMPLRSDRRLGQGLRRYVPLQVRDSRLGRRIVNGLRNRAQPVREGADVTVYPFSYVPVRAESSVLVLHDLRRFQAGEPRSGYTEIIERNVERAAAIAVSWPHPYQAVLDTFPQARDKTALIPLPTFNARPTGADAEPERGFLIYPSSTAEHKNHATLLEGMSLLPDFRLACPGPLIEPVASTVLGRVAKPDLAGRVSFPGFVSTEELADMYRRAWAVVVPSTWEAASGAIFEAFSWGLPVACADVAPLRSQVEFAGGDAAFFEPFDPASVAAAIEQITANRDHFAAASRRASKRLADRSWADTARDYVMVCEWVKNGRVGPVPQSSFLAGADS